MTCFRFQREYKDKKPFILRNYTRARHPTRLAKRRFIEVYGNVFDIRLALDQTVEKWGGRMLFFRVNKTTIEVIAKKDEEEVKDSLWGMAWDVENLEATHKRLDEEGFELTEVKEGRKPNTLVATVKSKTHNIPTLLIQHLAV